MKKYTLLGIMSHFLEVNMAKKNNIQFKDEGSVKKYLESYRLARIEEYNYLVEADDIASAKLFRNNVITGMPVARGKVNDVSDTLERTIDEQWERYMHLRSVSIRESIRVKAIINELDNPEDRKIVLHKYILLKQNLKPKTWEEVAEETGYSRTTVLERGSRALTEILLKHPLRKK